MSGEKIEMFHWTGVATFIGFHSSKLYGAHGFQRAPPKAAVSPCELKDTNTFCALEQKRKTYLCFEIPGACRQPSGLEK